MEITTEAVARDTVQTVQMFGTIAEAAVRPLHSGGRTRHQWRPERIRVMWRRHRENAGEWSEWAIASHVTVSGTRVRQDGSDGAPCAIKLYGSMLAEWKDWLRATRPADD